MGFSPKLPPPPADLLVGASLFVDFDGTLVDLAPHPDRIEISPKLRRLIARLAQAMPGRIAILSGRSLAQLDGFLGPHASGIALGGSHGVERRNRDGSIECPLPPPGLAAAAEALGAFAAEHPGTIVERKSFGVALHYRLAPEVEALAARTAHGFAQAHGLEIQPGKMMTELKIAGGNKGEALRAFMRTPPMAGTRPWCIGDDLTDEAGFAAAQALGGGGILVGARPCTAARFALPGVGAVHRWLEATLRCL